MHNMTEVEDVRLASGVRSDQRKGDIYASLSLDLIPAGRVRKPFTYDTYLMVATSLEWLDEKKCIKAYRLIPRPMFDGEAVPYGEKLGRDAGVSARSDPYGFYHGMLVNYQKQEMVLSGPPMIFVGRQTPKQLEMF